MIDSMTRHRLTSPTVPPFALRGERSAEVASDDSVDIETLVPAPLQALLAKVEAEQPSLRGHGHRTAMYAEALGRRIGFSGESSIQLRQAAFLHDIGKSMLPGWILRHPGPLADRDYARYQSHPRHALALLAPWPDLLLPSIWIAHHHERWDGAGYPYGLRGEHIPLASRIIAIADAFDQLCVRSQRSFAADSPTLLRILRNSANSQFDPHLVEQFCELWVPTDHSSLASHGQTTNGRLPRCP